MLDNIRLRLDEPLPQKPSDRTLLLLLSTQIQRFINKANRSSRSWAVDELTLVANSGQEDYPLPIDSSFGKPIQVRTVYASDPGHVSRDVPFSDLGDLNFDWPFPGNFGSSLSLDGSPNNAVRMAFFRKSGSDQVWVRMLPVPGQSSTYQVLYQIGVYGSTTPLDETPLLPEHHDLIEIRTAISALPHSAWFEETANNTSKRKELAMTLTNDSADLEKEFTSYITSLSAAGGLVLRTVPFPTD